MAMIYSWAIRRRLLRYTPFVGLEKPFEEQKRSRTFSNEELRRLVGALKKAPKQIAGLWLLLLYTGNRLRETLKMEWAWIDKEKKYVILPGSVTKNRRDHLVPLVPQAERALEALKQLAGNSPYVFPGPKGTAMNWVQKACDRIMANAQIADGRHHDTRRVLQTNMAELRVPPHVADMILNHAIKDAPKSRAHYDTHHYIPEKRKALTQWVNRLIRILGYNPNEVLKAKRNGYQGKGEARRIGVVESYRERKARLAAQGRDLDAERRERRSRGGEPASTLSRPHLRTGSAGRHPGRKATGWRKDGQAHLDVRGGDTGAVSEGSGRSRRHGNRSYVGRARRRGDTSGVQEGPAVP
jgi:hypothetical protein